MVAIRIDEELTQESTNGNSVLTIGVFDGVHRGHQHLITTVTERAKSEGLLSGVITFRNHPLSIIRSNFTPQYLTTLEDRIHLIRGFGIDFVIAVTFDTNFAKLSARGFIEKLQSFLRMRGLMIGPDFAMGHNRECGPTALTELGSELGFWVQPIDLLAKKGRPIKSTIIREALTLGDINVVNDLLGREFSLNGVVIDGEKRGRQLGFPTANLEVALHSAIPGDGIYATWAVVRKKTYMAATSIGIRPTFSEGTRTIEAFLLDFHEDIYGEEIRLEFVRKLRNEIQYDTQEALLKQISLDIEQTKALLSNQWTDS